MLETRLAPAVILWDGGPTTTGTVWNDPANWAGDVLPGPADDAQIGGAFAGITVTASSNVTIRSLTSAAALQISAGTFALGAADSRLDAAFTVSGGTLRLDGTTLNGTGTLINAGTMESNSGGAVNVAVNNQAVVEFHGTKSLGGSLSNTPGGTVRVKGTSLFGPASLTVASGFSNQGTIELTGEPGFDSKLTVTSGTLTNTGTINVTTTGSPLSGGSRTLDAQLDNQETLSVRKSLNISKVAAAHKNSGTISVAGGDLSLGVAVPGTTPSFTNTGSVSIAGGRTMTVNAGTFSQSGTGSISGAGTLALSVLTANFDTGISVGTLTGFQSTINYTPDLNTATTTLSLTSTIFNSPGTVSNTAGKTLTLANSTLNAGLSNQGLLLGQGGFGALNGAFGNAPGGTLRVEGTSLWNSASLTVASGFSNQGTIELSGEAGFASKLAVTSGTLTNTGTISVLSGSGRTLQAQLDNQGTLDVQTALTMNKAGAAHTNRGTIAVAGGDLSLGVGVPGTTPSFTNSGTITIAGGRTMTILSGTFSDSGAGSISGAGTLALAGLTATFDSGISVGTLTGFQSTINYTPDLNTATTTLSLTSTIFNSPGTVSNAAGKTLTLANSTLNAGLSNQGLLQAQGAFSAVNGAFGNAPGGTLRIEGTSLWNAASLTVASGFNNRGTIELTGEPGFASTLVVTSGTLTNAVGGFIRVLPGRGRTLAAQLDNRGALELQSSLTLRKASASHNNSGRIAVTGGDLTVSQSGSLPSFTNSGVIDVAANRTFSIDVGGLTNNGSGILTGHPAGAFVISGNLLGQSSNADQFAPPGTVRLTGGSAFDPQLLEVMGQDRGNVAAGFTNNFVIGTLSLGNFVRLVDNADNSSGAGSEALYVNTLIVPAGSTLDLNHLSLYARAVQIDGTVIGGTINQTADGGPTLNTPTPGTIALTGEVDDWTFFGRAGRAVTVVVNPGPSGVPAPLNPILGFAEVRLLSPAGDVLAAASSAALGQIVTLPDVQLPADGIYRVQVRAAVGGNRGNYMLTVGDASVDTMPLLFNQRTTGVLETPFSLDRWTFAARANQHVVFDWINAASPSISFRLTGPAGFTGFSGLTGDSGPVTLPADGTYVLEASALGGAAGSYAFRLVETSEIPLTLGTTYTGTLSGSGQQQLFVVNLAAGEQLRVVLHDSAGANRNELYAQLGAPPTRADFQFSATAASADQELFVPSAAPGAWYILLYSEAVPAPGAFTLTATAGDIFLTAVTPDHYSSTADAVLTLTGAGFDHTTIIELVSSDGTAFPAASVSINLPTQLTATFAAASVPAGTYSVRARRPTGGSAVLPGAFQMLAGGQARLETNLVLPSFVGRHAQATIYVEYANTGDAAMPAPLLVLHGSDRALLTLDEHGLTAGFWMSAVPSAVPDGYSDTVQILGSGATPGVLQPGEHVRAPVYFVGLQQPWDFNDTSVDFNLTSLGPENTTVINWPSLQTQLRPPGISDEAWAPIYANLTAQIGGTWGDFAGMLDDNAQYLGRLGQRVVDVSQLWTFEVEQAIGFSPLSSLAGVSDIRVEAPGLPITFGRVFSSNIVGRYDEGPLGRGWAWADGWQRLLTVQSDGKAVVAELDGRQRRFEPDSRRVGSYFGQAGDHATLTALDGGALLLRELDGLQTRFRSDGRVEYVEDPNGNRVTATYSGAQLTRLTHSAGQFLDITYNAGRIASLTDQAGRTVVYTYDGSGEHLTSVRGIDGQTTRYTYSSGAGAAREHGLLSIEYPDNTHEFFTYDPRGRLNSSAGDNNAARVTFGYDSAGRVAVTDAQGGATKYFFDQDGFVAAVEDALGRRTLFGHDSDLNLTSVTDALGQSELYRYDGRGNLVRATNPLGQVTSFSYTADFNRLASVTDARGNPMNYGYDSRGNLTSITYADGSIERFAPDARGEPDSWTNRRGQLIDYRANADGRLERRDLPGGAFVEYRYNARGNLDQAIDPAGTTRLEYLDPQNPDLPTKIAYPNGRFLEYTYQNGRRTRMVDQDGFTVNELYDAAGRLEFLRDAAGSLIVQYHYDAAGRLERQDHGNGTFTIYHYDAAGQLEHLINNAPSGTVNSRFDYVYDDLGRRTRMTTLDGVWNYSYDGIGELTRAVFTSNDPLVIPNQDLQYVYDAAGNRIRTISNGVTTDYVTNNLNQYTRVGTANLTYDLDGNLISRSDGGSTTTYAYNAENRLVGVTLPGETWAYQYDAFDNRSATVHNGQRTDYLIDPFGLGDTVGEYNASGSLIAHYAHGLGLTSRVDFSGMAGYYDFDATASTAGITGSGGTYVNSYAYLPFGESLRSVEKIVNPFRFVGQFGVTQESEGVNFMRARFYSPAEGRFLNPDPLGLAGGQVNLYTYVAQNPLSRIDPSGLEDFDVAHGAEHAGCEGVGATAGHGIGGVAIATLCPLLFPQKEVGEGLRAIVYRAPKCGTTHKGTARVLAQLGYAAPECLGPDGGPARRPSLQPPLPSPTVAGPGGSSGTVGSGDPNDKTGPAGFGPAHFIPAQGGLSYRIDFENEGTATAPAQRVVVTDPLDANLDWSTFGWTEVGFGDNLIAIPTGTQHFQTSVPMTLGGRTFQVEIELSMSSQTGLLTAVFQSIDPATSLPPDVLTGFLPPEDGTGRGQGQISYTVRPRAALPTGTEMKNIALVTFDVNEPIATNQVDPHNPAAGTDPNKEARNTLDGGIPTSSVTALPAQSPASFTVQWSGADDPGGSGIGSFDIFVSENGGAFTPWLQRTSQTFATFVGEPGRRYAFYSIARDNVGNIEPPPPTADTETTVHVNQPPVADAGNYQVAEGVSSITLTGAGSDPDGDPLIYSWDLNNDGIFETFGQQVTLSTAGLDGPSTLVVVLQVCDDLGACATATAAVGIINTQPKAALSVNGGNAIVNEGSIGQLTFGNQSDPSPADVAAGFRYAYDFNNDGVFDLGDGTYAGSSTSGSVPLPASLVDDGPGTRTIRARILDKDGAFSDYLTTITISNVAPTATLSNNGPVNEGATATVSFSSLLDPSTADTTAAFRYAYDFDNNGVFEIGDGSYAGSSASASATVLARFLDDGPGTRKVRARILDKDGGFTDYLTTITINNVAPTATIRGTTSGFTNSPLGLIVAATDPSQGDLDSGFTFTIDWGDGSPAETILPTPSSGESSVESAASHNYVASGLYTVQVTARDDDFATSAPAHLTVQVTNAPGPFTVPEGGSVTLSAGGPATDPDGNPLTYAWDLDNNGSFETPGENVTFSAAELDGPDSRTVRLRRSDSHGFSAQSPVSVIITNVAPTATLTGPTSGVIGRILTFTVGATDPSSLDRAIGFTYAINWGDGSPVQTILRLHGNGSGEAVDHIYIVSGLYTLQVTAADQDNGTSAPATFTVGITGLRIVTWNGASQIGGHWSDPGNWVGSVAPVAGDDLIFPSTSARLTSTNDFPADTAFNSITLEGGGYVLGGNRLSLGHGGLVVNGGAQTVSFDILPLTSDTAPIAEPVRVADGGTLTLSGALGGAMGLHKTGAGTLILGGANTYTGVTQVDEGVLNLRNSSALGSTFAGTEMHGGATLVLQGNISVGEDFTFVGDPPGTPLPAVRIVSSGTNFVVGKLAANPLLTVTTLDGTLAIAGVISGNDDLVKDGAGTLILSAANTYTGRTRILQGALNIRNSLALGSSAGGTELHGGTTLVLQDNIAVQDDLTFVGDPPGRQLPAVRIVSSGANFVVGKLAANPMLAVTTLDGTFTIAGIISGNDDLLKDGAGTLILNADNALTGSIRLLAGMLLVNGSQPNTPIIVQGGLLGGTGLLGPITLEGGQLQGPVLQASPLHPGQRDLVVGGTAGIDNIRISRLGDCEDQDQDDGDRKGEEKAGREDSDTKDRDGPPAVIVRLNGKRLGTFQPTGRIIIYGQAGDDDIRVSASITLSAWLYGGAGNDRLKSGSGDDVLLGGEGDDVLIGGDGRDLLIGGTGSDRLVGDAQDDILIAGTTNFDANVTALGNIMAEWARRDAGYTQRIDHLDHGGGLSAGIFLTDTTVHDDASEDRLSGSSGHDWFFANRDSGVKDIITDLQRNEIYEDID